MPVTRARIYRYLMYLVTVSTFKLTTTDNADYNNATPTTPQRDKFN